MKVFLSPFFSFFPKKMKKIFTVLSIIFSLYITTNAQTITFSTPVNYTVGDSTTAIVSADFNGDSKLDVAVLNSNETNLSIIFNNGDGTFSSSISNINLGVAKNLSASSFAILSVGDFNGDGKPDIAVIFKNIDSVGVLLNNGSGTFAAMVKYLTGNGPVTLSNADLNGDAKTDLVIANNLGNSISVLINNGDGTFANKVDYSGSFFSPSLVAASRAHMRIPCSRSAPNRPAR